MAPPPAVAPAGQRVDGIRRLPAITGKRRLGRHSLGLTRKPVRTADGHGCTRMLMEGAWREASNGNFLWNNRKSVSIRVHPWSHFFGLGFRHFGCTPDWQN